MVNIKEKSRLIKNLKRNPKLLRAEGKIMCPYWDYDNKRCKVSPSVSQCYKTDGEQQSYCLNSNYKSCANYEAYQRGNYKIER